MQVRTFELQDDFDIQDYTKFKALTKLINAISLTFPVGEKFFIGAVRHYEQDYSPALQENCKIFYKQEAMHSRIHRQMNEKLAAVGVPVKQIELEALQALQNASGTPEYALMTTDALERLTEALGWITPPLAKVAFKDNSCCEFLKLHAMEELEHASVSRRALKEVSDVSKLKYSLHFVKCCALLAKAVYKNYQRV